MWLDYRRKRFWVVALFLLYVLSGYFLAPVILRREIVDSLQKALDHPVQLAEVRVDPLIFSVDLRGFRLDEKDGSALAGFDRLYIRFSLTSPFRWAWCFDTIRLEGAKGNFIRFSETDTNFGRLLAGLSTTSKAVPAEKETAQPRLIVDKIQIVNATADVADHAAGSSFKTTIGPVTVDVSRLSTLPDASGDQHVLVELEGGATLEWAAQSSLKPLASTGHIAAKGAYPPLLGRYLGDVLKLTIPTGKIDATLDYQFRERPDGILSLAVERADFALDGLTVQEPSAASPFLTLPELRLTGGHMAWPEKKAGADRLSVVGLDLAIGRMADGSLLPGLLSPAPAPAPAKTDAPAPAASPAGPDWSFALGKAELKNAKVKFDDHAIGEPARTELGPIDFSIDALTNKPNDAFPFSLAVGGPLGGSIAAQGRLTALPTALVETKLTVADIRIAAIQRYLHDFARISIDDGKLSIQADVKLRPEEGLSVVGSGEIRALKLTDEVEKTPVISWSRLGIDRYEYRQSGNELQLAQVTLDGPFLRFKVAADQTTNFSHILIEPKPAPAKAPPPQKQAAPASPMKISVGKIAVTKGTVDYADASLPLPFSAKITDFRGDVASLSSTSAEPARIALRGQVGAYGQAKIDGRLTPFDPSKNTKIGVVFRNVEFPDLSPYTVKFAGRRIAGGRLDVDLQYTINEGRLNGANKVVIRDIELGEKVDVPGAMNLPLELAIALLKDSDGKIDVDLAVSGNTNDPQFDIGSVVTKAVFRVLTNLITAPFRALASLFGGDGDDLGQIAFTPGSAELEPPEREKLVHLAQIMGKRPNLRLQVPEAFDPKADRDQLQIDTLEQRMTKELGERDTLRRQRRFLESLFEERIGEAKLDEMKPTFSHPPQGKPEAEAVLDEPAFVAALRDAVAKTEPVDDARLAQLGKARAETVAAALRQIPGFDPKRITIGGDAATQAGEDGAIPLKLDAASTEGE